VQAPEVPRQPSHVAAGDACSFFRLALFVQIRSDANLAYLREDERFKPMMNKFDEPILNENAVRAIKNLFNFGKKE
jgi:hypothetical protein